MLIVQIFMLKHKVLKLSKKEVGYLTHMN